ncbi:uncharacterized protein N7511_002726 [Penicillium nucicola]|uniref:uncharacterized protein n=1 Tax=Penicillium nucicola TaxID=1850975 RepID=UPI0025450307|nr:uncharacterized protein N7511_002726 [Penicillium nucicola]KAJ5770675.1 hypothetical protein N7511_002726 [Penicillium nucicola]
MLSKILSVLFLLGLIGNVLAINSLGVVRDTSMGNKVKAFSSKCTVKTKPEDAEFLLMIKTAWQEMNSSFTGNEKRRRNEIPFAMIGLSIDDELYFSSSVKAGSNEIVYQTSTIKGGTGELKKLPSRYAEVTEALTNCTRDNPGKGTQHGNSAACGEIMSTILWMHDHEGKIPRAYKPKVAAWSPYGYLPPCSSKEGDITWGCHQWTAKMGYTVVGNLTLPNQFTQPEKCESLSLNTCLKIDEESENGKGKVKGKGKQ